MIAPRAARCIVRHARVPAGVCVRPRPAQVRPFRRLVDLEQPRAPRPASRAMAAPPAPAAAAVLASRAAAGGAQSGGGEEAARPASPPPQTPATPAAHSPSADDSASSAASGSSGGSRRGDGGACVRAPSPPPPASIVADAAGTPRRATRDALALANATATAAELRRQLARLEDVMGAQSRGASSSRPLSPERAGRLVERAYAALWAERARAAEAEARLKAELEAVAEQRDRASLEARRLRRAVAGGESSRRDSGVATTTTPTATATATKDTPRCRRISSAPSLAWSDDDPDDTSEGDVSDADSDVASSARNGGSGALVRSQSRSRSRHKPQRAVSLRGSGGVGGVPACASLPAPELVAAFFAAAFAPVLAALHAAAAPCATLFARPGADVAGGGAEKPPRPLSRRVLLRRVDHDDVAQGEGTGECGTPA